MKQIDLILENTSLWEVAALLFIVYLFINPEILLYIKKIKLGQFELEIKELHAQIIKQEEKVAELELEIENSNRFIEEITPSFDANSPLSSLQRIKQSIKANAKNMSDIEEIEKYLTIKSSPEELYAVAVTLREKRPPSMIPHITMLLKQFAEDKNMHNIRLNTIWTFTSALHLALIAAIRDGVSPTPSKTALEEVRATLKLLENNPRVINDRPDDPDKGIRGPIKHCLQWVDKALNN